MTKEILDRASALIAQSRVQEALLLTQVLVDQPEPSRHDDADEGTQGCSDKHVSHVILDSWFYERGVVAR